MINIVADFLLPPASLAVFAFVVLLIGVRWCRIAALVSVSLLLVLGVPLVSTALLNSLSPPAAPAGGPVPEAIVILSADGVQTDGATDLDPGPLTLDRTRAGAALARRTGLRILVTGGRASDARTTLAAMMAASLRDDFRLPTEWQEDQSRDTWENAELSARLLRKAGISRVYLVTHDWHMRRALLAFRRFGLDPVAAPVRQPYMPPLSWRSLLINPAAWFNSYIALHEWVGLLYYETRR